MPGPAKFDVWIWNSAHPERPSRSRPNTRAPSTFPRVRRRENTSPIGTPPDSPFSPASYPPYLPLALPSLKYGSTLSRRQKVNACNPARPPSVTLRRPHLQQFENFSTGEILYALISLGLTQDAEDSPIQHGGLLPDIYMLSPLSAHPLKQAHRICGYAHTIEMTRSSEDAPHSAHDQRFIEAAPNDSIIVASLPSRAGFAAWDKFLTAESKSRGVRGAIVSGPATDLEAHRETGFSVFAQCYSPPDPVVTAHPSRMNIPVTFSPRSQLGTYFKDSLSTVRVFPGDIIVADIGGAVCVPIELAREVLNLCNFSTH